MCKRDRRSPLRECGLGKPEIRRLSREAGLFTAEKPAYACLATRIPAGTPIDGETLQKVERAEAFLTDKGFSDFRVRVLGNAAKLQLTENEFAKLFADRGQILDLSLIHIFQLHQLGHPALYD